MLQYQAVYDKLSGIYFPELKLKIETEKSSLGSNWYEAKEKLLTKKNRKPSIAEFAAFLNVLRNGSRLMLDAYKDITEVRHPYRACWLNAFFIEKEGRIYLQKYNFDGSTVDEKLDSDTLMKDRRISLEDWLSNPTKQGLPKESVREGSLYYGLPMKNSVARFFADSVRARLFCGWGPTGSGPGLGVRRAKFFR